MKKLKSLFFPTILALAFGLMLSCSKSSEDNINDTVAVTNDAIDEGVANTNENLEDTLEDNNDTAVDLENALNGGGGGGGSNNQSQCTSVITFQKGMSGTQAKQTNDCGYIVASYKGKLTKLDERGGTKWETKITLKQAKHSNLGKPSVIQTRDGGYLYSDNDGIAKVGSNGEIEWTYINKDNRDFEDAIEHSNGYFYLVSDDLASHKARAKVYKVNGNGKKIWRKGFGTYAKSKLGFACHREKFKSILETSDGELIIVGAKSHGNKQFSCTFEFYDDAWIIKVDADNGGKHWEKTYGGKNFEHLEDIVKNPNGGYYAIGTACNKRNPPEAGYLCGSNMSAFWMKIDDNGNKLSQKFLTMGPNQTGFSITNTSSGGTAWVGLNKKYVGNTALYRAVFYKQTGNKVNYSKVVDLGSGNATSIELTKDGGFIIVAGKNVFKTDSDMKIPTLETQCFRSKKSLCP